MTAQHGVLVVDKPPGKTSHDIVAEARRLFGTRAVGHAGTLDPMATGVLLLLLGEATKLSPFLSSSDKRYLAEVSFGRSTDSFDADGQTSEERPVARLDESAVLRALALERARSEQVPPAFSAIKVEGQRAHRLSRQGRPPELGARAVTVHSLELRALAESSVTLELLVSKGYFVRSLARDLCSELGVPGHLSSLRRLASGPFAIDEACTWPAAGAAPLSVAEAALRCLPARKLNAESVPRARQGKRLAAADFEAPASLPEGERPQTTPSASLPEGERPQTTPGFEGLCAWLDPDGELVAIGNRRGEDFRVVRGFNAP